MENIWGGNRNSGAEKWKEETELRGDLFQSQNPVRRKLKLGDQKSNCPSLTCLWQLSKDWSSSPWCRLDSSRLKNHNWRAGL